MCDDNGKNFYSDIAQRTFGTISMRQVILNYCGNEFRKYLFISQKVLYSVLWRQKENFGYFATYFTAEILIFGRNTTNIIKK